MPRRRRGSAPFSLFAFQDIITSVTGIMVLVTLFLALELVQRKEGSPPEQTKKITEDIHTTMVQNQAEAAELEKRQRELSALLNEMAAYDTAAVRREIANLQAANKKLQEEAEEQARERDDADRRKKQAEAEATRIEQDRRDLDEILKKTRTKQAQLDKLKQSKRLFFNASEGAGKTPWLVELTEDHITVAQVGSVAAPRQFETTDQLVAWAKQRNRNSEYFVLLVKPDGIEKYVEVYPALRQGLKFDIGFDLLTEEQTAIDPETGATP